MHSKSRIRSSAALIALCVLALSVACDKDEADSGSDPKAAKESGPPAKDGPVTLKRFEEFDQDKVTMAAADFRNCLAIAEAQLGKVGKIDGNEHWWAAMNGEDCHAYILISDNKNQMSRSTGPYKVRKSEHEKCKRIAG